MNITETIQTTRADLAGLTVFSHLKKRPLLTAFIKLLEITQSANIAVNPDVGGGLKLVRRWACFTKAFIGNSARRFTHGSFYEAIAFLVRTADNPFTRAAESAITNKIAAGKTIPPLLRAAAAADLERLGRIAAFDISQLGFHIADLLRKAGLENAAQNIEAEARAFWAAEGKAASVTPELFPRNENWSAALPAFIEYIRTHGAGDLGLYHAFSWAGDDRKNKPEHGKLRPVEKCDPVRLSDLSGYEDQRSIVIANTLRFLEGKPANNLLLYGDRGTGKSATVKAVCNEYADRGLRLLEVHKKDLFQLPVILKTLDLRAMPFIVFIDDLSFEVLDDSFTGLKALLEGGVEVRPPNVVIYATSNRRHLIKERIADRPGPGAGNPSDGEVRAFDTMQEQFSLADRFGLTVVFTSPNQDEYLSIAEFIARKRGLLGAAKDSGEGSDDNAGEALKLFRENALRWERWFNGRSPRTAVQYVDWVAAGTGFPWE
ncbi:MAG: ATP-binding protein [Treponema sp.]|nr:ATP-binding protein [Treponema sp.]